MFPRDEQTRVAREMTVAVCVFDRPEDESLYRAWLADNSAGYVVNTTRPNVSQAYLKLHLATCWSISRLPPGRERFTSGEYQKVCSNDLAELERWARVEVGGQLDPCGLCYK